MAGGRLDARRLGGLVLVLLLAVVLAWWVLGTAGDDERATGDAEAGAVSPVGEPLGAPGRRPLARSESRPETDPQAAVPVALDEEVGDTGRPLPPLGYVDGRVVDDRGRLVVPAMVWGDPELCPVRILADDGEFNVALMAGTCRLQAARRDGVLYARSEVFEFEVVAGEHLELTLVVPSERTGGIGVAIREHREGMRVDEVFPGTPAWEAGLQGGDIITEVDGTPAALLSLQDFQTIMTGPEGTDIEFVVSFEGDTGLVEEAVVATRAFLDPEGR